MGKTRDFMRYAAEQKTAYIAQAAAAHRNKINRVFVGKIDNRTGRLTISDKAADGARTGISCVLFGHFDHLFGMLAERLIRCLRPV